MLVEVRIDPVLIRRTYYNAHANPNVVLLFQFVFYRDSNYYRVFNCFHFVFDFEYRFLVIQIPVSIHQYPFILLEILILNIRYGLGVEYRF